MNTPHWSQLKESGSVTGMRILLFAHRLGGDILFRVLLFPVIGFYVIFQRHSYVASREYLQRLHEFGKFPPPRPWHIFRHFWNFGVSLLDKLSVWTGKINIGDVVLHDKHVVEDLLAQKRGALLLISHLGNFEICQALSEEIPDLQLTVLHHTKHAAKFNHLLDQTRSAASVSLLQVTEIDMAMAMQLGERIGTGQFLAMSADRVAINNPSSSRLLSFMGHLAPFPSGPFVLGLVLQAPVITVFCIKEAGRYHVYFDTLWEGGEVKRADRAGLMARLMQQYVGRLEYHCQKTPLQWYNFYSFWHREQQ
ncbi:MAG: hypothetical protein V4603_12905 [Pseudomonadota bacterium]